jgi:hypothetical protein
VATFTEVASVVCVILMTGFEVFPDPALVPRATSRGPRPAHRHAPRNTHPARRSHRTSAAARPCRLHGPQPLPDHLGHRNRAEKTGHPDKARPHLAPPPRGPHPPVTAPRRLARTGGGRCGSLVGRAHRARRRVQCRKTPITLGRDSRDLEEDKAWARSDHPRKSPSISESRPKRGPGVKNARLLRHKRSNATREDAV